MFESAQNSCLGREDGGFGLLSTIEGFIGEFVSFMVITDSLQDLRKARLINFGGEFIMEELEVG